ncbi:MAG: phosphoglucomutase/phosphomannomutase family protein [SAR202 cluster bacterium]|nr:phosphoglucomutase/phosphomannomutase family protein [SAR202 cluster bacterium]
MPIKFGTDGWRAIIAEDFTFDNVARCAQGVAGYLKASGASSKGLVVGHDTRFASREFAQRVAEVLAGNGVKAMLCNGAAPTPAVSYNVLAQKAAGAAIITASHNPAIWNGFKYKPEYAGSASSEVVAELERHIEKSGRPAVMPLSEARQRGLVREIDPRPAYFQQMKRLVDLNAIKGSGLNIMVDAMHGAGGGYVSDLLSTGRVSLEEMRGQPNPAFPGMHNPEPIAHNLTGLSSAVVESKADAGIAFDGDADRLGIVDEKGQYINTLQAFALLALYLLDVKGERGAIVKSVTSSDMLVKLGDIYNVPVLETGVGFKYIGPQMMKHNALIAGEESGGYAFRGHIPERDGILSGLLMLEFMVRKDLRPSELLSYLYSKVGEHFYHRRDVSYRADDRPKLQAKMEKVVGAKDIAGLKVKSVDATDGYKFRLDHGWLMIRFSGTEPLIRLYAEADSPQRVESLLDSAAEMLGV